MEKLEDRVLFDAVPDGGFLLQPEFAEDPMATAQEMSVDTTQQAEQEQQPRELVLVDANVENADQLIAEILEERHDRTLEIRLLSADRDGIDQISEILESTDQAYDAIHIVSHGSQGSLSLGSSTLDADSLQGYASQFVGWADALTEDADLLFYGCNLAENDAGEAFVETLSSLTGADVAASDDFTGSSELGGDWDLEVSTGEIETETLTFAKWFGLLADFTPGVLTGVDIGPATDTTSPTNWTHVTGAGTTNGLVSEDGTNSGYSLTLSTTGAFTSYNTDPSATTIPNHSNDLSGIDGSLVDNSGGTEQITLTWGNLTAGQEYAVYTFSHVDFNSLQTIDITGGNGTVSHADKFFNADDLLVNGAVGNSGVDLEDSATIVTADASGQITITITSAYWAVVSGTAISEVSGLLPHTTADVNMIVEDSTPNPITGNVLTNDSTVVGTLSVSEVNGNAAAVGNTINGAHGTLTLNADGSYTYTLDNNDAAVQSLNQQDNIVYIGGDDGTGTGSSTSGRIEALNLTTGATSVVTSTNLVPYINGLAANADNNLAYYSDETTLYYWDPTTDTHAVIADLTTLGIAAGEGMLSGGGTYFNGSLYIGTEPDGGGPMVDVYELQLTADGRGVVSTNALGVDTAAAAAGFPDVGGFGDLIISDGGIYGSTTVAGFWRYDLTSGAFEQISSDYLGQLAATEDGRIFSVNGTSVQQIDRATGALTGATMNTTLTATDASSAISAPQNPNSVLTESFTYTVVDDDGDTQTATLEITIQGQNDPPQASDFSTTVHLNSTNNAIGISAPSDVDNTLAELSITFDSVPPASQGTYTIGVGGTAVTTATTISGDQLTQLVFTPANGYSGSVADLNYTVTDPRGLSDSGVISISVSAPPTANDNSGTVTEDTDLTHTGNVITDNDGSGVDSDPDGDTLTVVAVNGNTGSVNNVLAGSYGRITINSDGSYTYDLDNNNAVVNALGPSDSLSDTFTYTIDDGSGQFDTASLVITIDGTNDAPVVTGTVANQVNIDGESGISLDVSGVFNDVEPGSLTFAASNLPNGLSIDASTGLITGTIASDASQSGPYTVVLTAQDSDGATVQHSFTWTVTNPPPVATDNDLGTSEGSSLSGNVMTDNDGNGVDNDPDGDTITVSEVNGQAANVASSASGTNGGVFTINANGSYTFATGTDFEYLAAGETATTSINYTISDGEGGTDTATVTVTVTGTNDAPTSIGTIGNQTGVDSTVTSPLDVSGFFGDADTSNTLNFSAGATLPPGLTIDAATGIITGTFDADASQGGPYTVVITATDDEGASITQSFTWTVTNPGPTATDNNLGTNEGSTLSGNVMSDNDGNGIDSDPDGDTINVTEVNGQAANLSSSVAGSNGGTFTINSDGTYTFATGADFEYLAAGETATTTVDYTISDGQGGTDTATVTITVTGTNDTPTTIGTIGNHSGVDSTVASPLDVSGFFNDADSSNSLVFSSGATLPPGLSIDSATGIITGTYDADASQGGPYSVVITATDNAGASVTQSFTWAVSNPGPTATDNDIGVTEGSTLSGNAMSDNDGSGVDFDVDGDVITVSEVNGQTANVGSAVSGSGGGVFTINSDGSYTFATGSDFDYLAAGETATTTVDYTITDSEGGTDTATVTVTVTGTNDTPTANGTIPTQSGVDGTIEAPLDLSGFFTDADTNNTLTYSAGTTLPPGLSIDTATGIVTGTYDADASQGGPYTVTITATDDAGATVTQSFTWTVTNPGPTATDNDLGTNEGSTLSGNVMSDNDGSGVDSDPDNDTITVIEVNGQSTNIDAPVAGSNGGTFTIASNGSYTFATGSDFEYLAAGETATTTVAYTISDGEGGTDTATVTITVTGTNDTPTAIGTIPDQTGIDSTVEAPLDVSGFFDDLDTNNTLTFDAGSSLPPGISIDPVTGIITGTYDADASQGGPYSVVITATDNAGATTTQSFTWTVTNPGPTATDNDLGTSEGSTLSGNVMSDDDGNGVDFDTDGDAITVSEVNGQAANVSTAVAGSGGGTFTIDSDGSYSFATGSDFDYLAQGETATTSVAYTISDGEGGTDTATVTITVTGTNDTPTANGTIPDQTGVDSTVESPLDVSGFFGDPDTVDTLTFSAGTTLPSGLSIDPATGIITGTYDADASQGGPYSVVITATDPFGASATQSFTWNVTNPGPTATDNDLGISQGSTHSGNVMLDDNGSGIDSDPDGDNITVIEVNGQASNVASTVAGSSGGVFTINGDGSYTFDTLSDFDGLGAGQIQTTTIDYTISDGEGGTDTATVTIVVSGANEAPTAVGTIPNQAGVDSTVAAPLDASTFFNDADGGDVLAFSDSGSLPPGLSIDSATGVITGTYDADASQGGPYSVTITATDQSGASVDQTFTWTVTNPGPTATNNDLGTNQGSTLSGNVMSDDDGNGVDFDTDGDVISVTEVNGQAANVATTVAGSGGGTFTINSNGTYTFATGNDFDYLAAGETTTTTVNYTISDGEGGIDTATVTVTVTGTNDTPTAIGTIPDQAGVDSTVESPLDVSGFFGDADTNNTLTFDAGSTLPSGLSIDSATGIITGTYDADASQGGPYTVVITATDDVSATATQSFTWTVTNPGPTATDNDLGTNQGSTLSGNVMSDDDGNGVDFDTDGDVISVTEVNGQAANVATTVAGSGGGTFTVNSNGTYTFATSSDFDYLAAGETATTTVNYTISDGEGGIDTATVTVTVTGTNDTPTAIGTIPDQAGVDSTVESPLDVSGFFGDADTSNTLTFDAGSTLPPGLSIDSATGIITGTYDADASQGGPYAVVITATDDAGATVTQSFTWTVANPGPTATDNDLGVGQGSTVSGNVMSDNDGHGLDFDIDGDAITVTEVNGQVANAASPIAGSGGGTFIVNSDGSYTFATGNDFDYLAAGETATTTIDYTISDGEGGIDTATVTVTVTGTNDTPTAIGTIPDQAGVDSTVESPLDVSGFFGDADTSNTLTFDAGATLPPGLSIDSATGIITGTYDADASQGGPYAVVITATDDAGVTVTQSFTWTVANPGPTATDNDLGTNQGSTLIGNVMSDNDGHGLDFDIDGDAITVTEVNGQVANVASPIAGSGGGTFIVNSDGSYTFATGNDFDYLAAGETATTTIDYTISDGEGGIDTATVTVTVTGTNDTPTAIGTIPDQTGVDSTVESPLDASGFFGDADTSNTLTFDAGSTLPPGLTIDSVTGIITGTYDADASQGGPYAVVITATDDAGATVTQSFTWTVANPGPTATDNDLGTNQGSTLIGNVMSDNDGHGLDFDIDGDAITVTEVNGQAANVASPIAGSGGGTFIVNSDGSYTFATGNDFDYLAAGETATTTIDYTISDGEGGIDTATVTVTVTGTNDTPTAIGTIPDQAGVDSTVESPLDVSGFFGDADTNNTLTFDAGSTLPPGLSINSATGIIAGTYDADASQGGPYTVVITATDDAGATVTQSFIWTVANPGPTATDNDLGVGQGSAVSGNVMLDNDGSGLDNDPDGDAISVVAVNGQATNVGTTVAGSNGGVFTIGSDGSYTFDTLSDFDSLGAGQTQATTINYTISDGDGGTDSATVTILVSGANETPTAVGTIPPQAGVDSTVAAPLDVSTFFDDADASDILSFSDNGSLPPGLSIDSATGVITGTYNASASVGGPYTVTVTATDQSGATVTQSFTWTVSNPLPTATDNDLGTSQGSTLSGNVMLDDDGHGLDSDPDGDALIVNEVNGEAADIGTPVAGTNGGTFTINGDGSYIFATGSDFDYLAAGETATTTIDYTISDGEGGTDSATVTVVITGTNDTPTAFGTIPDQTGVDSTVEAPLDVSGFFEDADTNNTLTFDAAATLPPGLSIDSATGIITGTYDADASQGGPYTVVVTATDDAGASVTQSFVWSVTNPGPTATNNDLATSEGSTLAGNVMVDDDGNGIDSDPDGDAITVVAVDGQVANVTNAVTGSAGGTFTINSDGTYTFDTGTDFEYLAAGETATTTVTYTISDAEGGTDTATVTATVSGANDTPTAFGTIPPQVGVDSTVQASLDISSYFGDADTTDLLTFSAGTTLPGGLSIDPATGIISGTFDANASQSGPYSVVITATDVLGESVTQSFTWTVTNPGPSATDHDLASGQGSTFSSNVILDDDGHGVDDDPDGDALFVSEVNGQSANVALLVAGTNGGSFTINGDGSYSFATGGDFAYLGAGETVVTSIDYTISDGEGGTATATVNVTVTGTNDTPTAVGTIPDQLGVDSTVEAPLDVSTFFGDADANNVFTFSDGGTLPHGLSIDAATGVIAGTYDANASQSGPYSVVITATDSAGESVTQSFDWTVTNPLPTATDNDLGASEGSTLSGNVMSDDDGHGIDNDPDGDTLVVSEVNGQGANVGSAIAGSSGGTFTLNADGSYTFATGSDFDYLAAGETATTTVDYTISDGEGGTDSATVTVIVSGTNNAPTASGTIPPQVGVDSTSVSPLDLSVFFDDVDATNALTFDAGTTLPGGLSIDSATGIVTGTFDADASQSGPYTVVVTATDNEGALVTQSFTWTVTNPGPTATDNDLGVGQGSTASGNVMLDNNGSGIDSDPDGDTITVIEVNGQAANVSTTVAGSTGGIFTINSDGSYTFDTLNDFDSLGAGQIQSTTVTYTISDDEGGTDSATVTIVVSGANETPTTVGTIPPQTGVDSTVAAPLDASTFFTDADVSDVLTFSDNGSLPPGLSIDAATGMITGTYDADASQGGPYTVTITATDQSLATVNQTFTWTVTNPTPTATDNDLGTTENASTSGNVIFDDNGHGLDSDPDGDTLVVSAVNGQVANLGQPVAGTNGGAFTLQADGSFTFEPGVDFDYLAAGETATTQVDYTVTDGEGGFDTATVTITVTGTNDTPTAIGTIPPQVGIDSTVEAPLDVSAFFGDPDVTNVLTFDAGSTLPPGLSIDSGTGVITGTYTADASQGSPYSVVVTATDAAGETIAQSFSWTVTNPGPTALNDGFATTQDTTITGDTFTDNGNGGDFDVDGDTITVQDVNGSAANLSQPVAGSNGGTFIINSNGSFSFDTGNDFDDLALGETRDTAIAYSITDGEGGTSTAIVTITVTGANDAPTSAGAIPPQFDTDSVSIAPVDVSGFFTDTDTTDVFTFDDGGSLPPGITIDAVTGIMSGTPAANASDSGPYTVAITATDNNGTGVTQTFTWNINNPGPTASDDDFATTQAGTVVGDLMNADNGNGVDQDPDGDTITVEAVNGDTANIGVAITGSNGGSFVVNTDGSYSFDAGTDFDSLAVGEFLSTQITYTITDGDLTATATVTVVVQGANDTPSTIGVIPDQNDVDSVAITPVSVAPFFGDTDATDVLTYSDAGSLPPGISIDANTGIISGTPNSDASVSGPYAVTITANDGNGGTITQSFIWNVTNPGPDAIDNNLGTAEVSLVSGNVIADDNGSGVDSDPDGDALTVSEVNGASVNVGSLVTGSGGGVFTINTDGTYTFNTGTDFAFLNVGESTTTSVQYTITDNQGGTDTATVTITVSGASAAPTAQGTIPPQTGVDSTVVAPLDLSGFFVDPDATDVLTFADGGTLPNGLNIDPATGIVTGSYTPNASAGGPYAVVITATDLAGNSVTQTFTWTVTNPAPTAEDNENNVHDAGPSSASGNVLTDTNALGQTDSDPDGDPLTVSTVAGTAISGPTVLAGTFGTLAIDDNGDYTYDLDTSHPAVDALGLGATLNETFAYTITDGDGGFSSAVLNITVTGTNDTPMTVGTIADQAGVDGTTVAGIPVAGFFADVDTGDSLVFSAGGTLPPGMTIDSVTGIISGTYAIDASTGGPYPVVITATDINGASTTQTFIWDVTNPVPIAQADFGTTDQNTSITLNVMSDNGSGADTDPDGDTLVVNQVGGSSAAVGQPVPGSNGGVFTINADGNATFDPQSDFVDLNIGESRTTQVTYTITDNEGGTSTATVTILVDGLDDAPVALDLQDQTSVEGEPIEPVSITDGFTDPDGTETFTYTDGGTLPPGLTLDVATGEVSGVPALGTAQIGSFAVTITATDSTGNSVSQDFTWNITTTFVFDSFRDLSDGDKQGNGVEFGNHIHHREVVLSKQIERLAPEPILAGYAAPGSVLIGRIYDASGSIIGEANLTVGPSGNWTMHFFGTRESNNTRVVIEHVATENVALGNSALKLSQDTYRALQLDQASKPSSTAGTILDGTAFETLTRQDGENINPLGLL